MLVIGLEKYLHTMGSTRDLPYASVRDYVTCDWTGVASAKNEGRALAVVVAMSLFKMYEGFEGWARELGGRDLNWSQKYPLGWGGGIQLLAGAFD